MGPDREGALWRLPSVNRLVPKGQALAAARQLAHELTNFPQRCLRSDRLSAYEQWSLPYEEALRNELEALHGGFAREPFADDSREYVFVARR